MISILKKYLYIVVLCSSVSAKADEYQLLAQKVSLAVSKVDRFFWGEQHLVREQALSFQAFLDYSSKHSSFEAIATEYVLSNLNDDFERYLNDPTATPGSVNESKFFQKMLSTNYIWATTLEGQNTYRALWRFKQLKPKTKICGIDHQPSYKAPATQTSQLWASFPDSLQKLVLKASSMNENDLLKSEDFWLREAAMALSIVNCTKESSHSLVHVGAFHAKNPNIHIVQNSWLDVAAYTMRLEPQKSIMSLHHTISPLSEDDEFARVFRKIYQSTATGTGGLRLMTRSELLPFHDELSYIDEENLKHSMLLWDLYILGPPGHESSKIQSH